MDIDEDYVKFQVKFQQSGIHELLSIKELLVFMEEESTKLYWETMNTLVVSKRDHDKRASKIMMALDLEISHQERSLEKEHDRTEKKLKERKDKLLGSI